MLFATITGPWRRSRGVPSVNTVAFKYYNICIYTVDIKIKKPNPILIKLILFSTFWFGELVRSVLSMNFMNCW